MADRTAVSMVDTMKSDLDNLEQLLKARSLGDLVPALGLLREELPSIKDTGKQRRALILAVQINHQLGNFAQAVECFNACGGRQRFPFHHPTMQLVVRSAVASFASGSLMQARPAIHGAIPLCDRSVDAIASHLRRDVAVRDQFVERCLDLTTSFADVAALLHLFHYFAMPVDADSTRAHVSRYKVIDSPIYLGLHALGEKPPGRSTPGYVFCSGSARSGTTAMGSMLNQCDEIALFTELYNPYLGYAPQMFERPALESDYFGQKYHFKRDVLIRSKIGAQTRYVGDKRPLFFNSWTITKQNFSPAAIRIIHLVRDPAEVVSSYAKRAARARMLLDPWPSDRTDFLAECDMSHQLLVIDEIGNSEFKGCIKLVRYPEGLTDAEEAMSIFEFLELRIDEKGKERVLREIDRNRAYMDSPHALSGDDAMSIHRKAPAMHTSPNLRFLTETELATYKRFLAQPQ